MQNNKTSYLKKASPKVLMAEPQGQGAVLQYFLHLYFFQIKMSLECLQL